jgi:hypothetical protein
VSQSFVPKTSSVPVEFKSFDHCGGVQTGTTSSLPCRPDGGDGEEYLGGPLSVDLAVGVYRE